ncbi:MAG: EpsG family protein, partial [Bacilli bacterium]|nr:EpsG family protein [Bacilli bacterium]
ICIVVSTIINILASKMFKKNKKKTGIFLLVLSLLVVSIIAGARTIYVGTDVRGYVVRLTNVFKSSKGIFSVYMRNAGSELLFSVLVYIGYYFRGMNQLLFLIEFAVALPIFIYAYLEKDKIPIPITIFVFFTTMYCLSLSMMRQSIAISMCILAYYWYDKNEKKKAYVALLIAFLFHTTAIIFFSAFVINKLFKQNIPKKGVLIPLIFISLFTLSPLLIQLISVTSYSSYLTSTEFMREFSWASILKKLIFVIMWMFCTMMKKDSKFKETSQMGLTFSLLSLFLTILSFSIPGMGRVGYYFAYLVNFLTIKEFPKIFKQKRFVTALLLLLYTFLWWHMTVVPNDPSAVYPYKSDIFDFLN